VKALLVDDEAPARSRLRRLLGAHPEIEIVGEAVNGLRALEEIDRLAPDIVFLDIEMPELDGLSVASCVRASGPLIVFVTAFDDHALRAFEVAAIDYLVKPVSDTRLALSIQKIARLQRENLRQDLPAMFSALNEKARRLALRSGTKFVVIEPDQLSAIIARDHYSALIANGREFLSDEGLDRWVRKLDAGKFLRVHRGAIINLDFLRELQREGDRKYIAVLGDSAGTKVPVSREKLDELKAILGVD
jgi:two-component system LytT family response regulator